MREAHFRHTFNTSLLWEKWEYIKANTEAIQRAISVFNCNIDFQNNEKIEIVKEILLNILNNFIPNKISQIDYKTTFSMNNEITLFLKKGPKLTKKYYNSSTDLSKITLIHTANECARLTISGKEKISSISGLNLRILTQPLKPTSLF